MAIISLQAPSTGITGPTVPAASLDVNKTFTYANGDPTDITAIEASNDGANWVRIVAATTGSSWVALVGSTKYANLRVNRLNAGAAGAGAVAFVAANDANVAVQIAPGGAPPFATVGVINGWLSTPTNTPTAAAAWQMPPSAANAVVSGALQFEINVSYRATASGNCGSRKVTGTIRANVGTILVDSQQNSQINDNAVFGAGITVALAVVGTVIVLNVTGLVTLVVDWNVNGIINQAV